MSGTPSAAVSVLSDTELLVYLKELFDRGWFAPWDPDDHRRCGRPLPTGMVWMLRVGVLSRTIYLAHVNLYDGCLRGHMSRLAGFYGTRYVDGLTGRRYWYDRHLLGFASPIDSDNALGSDSS